jgi:hypothetical protein
VRSNVAKTVVGLIAVLALGAFSAVPAFASGKPSAETKAATKVAEKEATLNGVVNPNGAATKYYFEYWKTATEKLKTAEVSAGSGTSNVEASATVTGLKAESHYEFRIVATNSNGTTDGKTGLFWTTAAAGLPEFSKGTIEPPANKFKTGGASVHFESTSGINYGCTSGSAEGQFTGVKTATVSFKFIGCGDGGSACTTEGDESGEITTASMPAQLVYLSKAKHEAGLVVNYHEETPQIATWSCPGAVDAGIQGSIIVPIAPVNTKTKSYTLHFVGTKGVQQPSAFEGVEEKFSAFPEMSLLGDGYQEGSLESPLEFKDVEAIEVKA